MASIDQELRDKIVQTHTIVERMDLEHKEHKAAIHSRIKTINTTIDKHNARITKTEHFRTKVLTLCSIPAILILCLQIYRMVG